jgi:general secretion pathway protein D
VNKKIMYSCSWSDSVRRISPLLIVVAALVLSGCAGTGIKSDAAAEADPSAEQDLGSFESEPAAASADAVDAAEAAVAAPTTPTPPAEGVAAPVANGDAGVPTDVEGNPASARAKVEIGTGKFLNEEASQRRNDSAAAEGEVVFNFEAESLQAVVKAILGDLLQENYVIAPGLAGQVTFATAKPISSDQAMGVLEMLLAWNNAAMVYRDGRYTVLPMAQAVPGNLVPRTGPLTDAKGYEVRAVPLHYISATAMQELLTPYARQGAILKADNTRSMIVLAGTRSDLENYLQTIETFDVDWLAGMSVGVYPLERVEAATVVPELEKVFGEGGPTPLAGLFRFMPIERINAVLVITPQSEYLARAEEWLRRLDRGGSESGAQLYVYYVKNVKAVDLGASLTDVFGGSGPSSTPKPSGVGGVAPGQEAVEIKSTNTGMRERPAPKTNLQPSSSEGISVVGSEDIRITAIEESNALMIRATPGEYEAILSAIKRLDIVPLQVHIEAKILRVDLSGELKFGVKWFFEQSSENASNTAYRNLRRAENERRQAQGLPLRNVWNSAAGSVSGSSGLAWTFLNTEAEAIVDMLQKRGNAQVLSAPSLVVLNNKTASINSGTSIPVSSVSLGNGGVIDPGTGNGGNVTNAYTQVQYRDTGITLDVTPRVNPGGLVYMEIKQEKSVPGLVSDGVNGNPPVDKSTIQTEIAVQSGETVVLAGLIEESESVSKGGIPGLVNIPILGRLFGTTGKVTSRQEILVLIKPTVIDSADSARNVTDEYKKRFNGLKPLLKTIEEKK